MIARALAHTAEHEFDFHAYLDSIGESIGHLAEEPTPEVQIYNGHHGGPHRRVVKEVLGEGEDAPAPGERLCGERGGAAHSTHLSDGELHGATMVAHGR